MANKQRSSEKKGYGSRENRKHEANKVRRSNDKMEELLLDAGYTDKDLEDRFSKPLDEATKERFKNSFKAWKGGGKGIIC